MVMEESLRTILSGLVWYGLFCYEREERLTVDEHS
jgi:hypothetical protein